MTEPRRKNRPSFTIHELTKSLGWQAGEAVHELNNLLTAVYGYAELGILETQEEDATRKYFNEILNIAERASDLIHELLSISPASVAGLSESETVNLNDVVNGMEKILRYILGSEIELVIMTSPDLAMVKAVPGQMQQVLLNLALNARDAMPKGGRVILQTDNVSVDEMSRPTGVDPGSYVTLAVGDNGSGIDESARGRIFEPYFTTKAAGSGTGLGLSTCERIINESGGCITFDSELGSGTEFKIYLPRVED